eukprot:TRINITY_DN13944_c0_g1_i1.p1 TRINITY_DN13944_c0_g1~~TRINITY_DN13944_c0_g1_i1.p1  ORF type:complete len:450 (-),score=97.40 TRINITY_DN13944_c0_g1_i1:87-1385(-)
MPSGSSATIPVTSSTSTNTQTQMLPSINGTTDRPDNDALVSEVRTLIQDLPEHILNDTAQIKRCLRSRGGNTTKAAEFVRRAYEWRITTKPESISEKDIKSELKTGKAYILGKDKQGRPMILLNEHLHDPEERDLDESIKFGIYWVEKAIAMMEPPVEQFIIIVDRTLSTRKNVDMVLIKELAKLQDYYCERLGAAYVIGANWIFQLIWKVVKHLCDKNTQEKVNIISKHKCEKTFLEIADKETLPPKYGGTSTYVYDFESIMKQAEKITMDQEGEAEVEPDLKKKITLDLLDEWSVNEELKSIVEEERSHFEKNLSDSSKPNQRIKKMRSPALVPKKKYNSGPMRKNKRKQSGLVNGSFNGGGNFGELESEISGIKSRLVRIEMTLNRLELLEKMVQGKSLGRSEWFFWIVVMSVCAFLLLLATFINVLKK